MKTIIKYLHVWLLLTANSFAVSLISRFNTVLFLVGKVLRFLFFGIFLYALFSHTNAIAEYSLPQTLFFYLTFNLIDTTTQLFFREVYRFRQLIVTGDFDLVLVKPMHPLFRALAGGADPFDLIMMLPYIGLTVYIGSTLPTVEIWSVVLYIVLLINGLLIATGFHILVLALAIVSTEVDHTIMIYRDITSMGRLPVDIYTEPLRSIVTFVVPVGIMMTYPARVLMGFLSFENIILGIVFGAGFFYFSLGLWRGALTKYASASS